VVVKQITFTVNFGKHVNGSLWFDTAYAWNLAQCIERGVALLQQTATGQYQFIDALVAAQRGLNCIHGGYVGTQTHGCEHFQPFYVFACTLLGPTEYQPARAKTCQTIRLGQSIE